VLQLRFKEKLIQKKKLQLIFHAHSIGHERLLQDIPTFEKELLLEQYG